jgi:DNA-directed RNA polymerase subunit L
VKSKVVHHVGKGTKKWVLTYVVKEGSTLGNTLRGFPTKGEAVNYAREYTEKNQIMTVVEMQKVLEKGDTKVAVVMYKKSTDERLGKWVLFGIAAE